MTEQRGSASRCSFDESINKKTGRQRKKRKNSDRYRISSSLFFSWLSWGFIAGRSAAGATDAFTDHHFPIRTERRDERSARSNYEVRTLRSDIEKYGSCGFRAYPSWSFQRFNHIITKGRNKERKIGEKTLEEKGSRNSPSRWSVMHFFAPCSWWKPKKRTFFERVKKCSH